MKRSILLLFGGESSEHEVSLVSARNVYEALDKAAYDVSLCYITHDGKWLFVDSFEKLDPDRRLVPLLGAKKFLVSDGTILAVDVLLPILHGAHGEDGDVQGLARLLHLPCVGPSLIGAAVTMDKDVAKRLLRDAGVPVVDWISWHTGETMPEYDEVVTQLGDTVFVKPANAGSSVGVSKVRDSAEYKKALELAAKHDSLVLIERGVVCREIEVAVLGNAHAVASTPGEIVPGADFYSYDDKYDAASTAEAKIPADLDETTAQKIKDYALTSYRATRGQGMARIDFFISDSNEIFLNEINSIPGFTNISMYPKLWQHDELSYSVLLDRLISLALDVYS